MFVRARSTRGGMFSRPPAFSTKPCTQVVKNQNITLPLVQSIHDMLGHRYRKASSTTAIDKNNKESLLQNRFC